VTIRKNRYQWTLASALLCALGFALLAIAVTDLRRINQSVKDSSQTQLRLLHDILNDELVAVIRSFDAASIQMADQISSGYHAEIGKRLELINSALPGVKTVLTRDISGQVLAQTGEDPELINTQSIFIPKPQHDHNTRLVSFSKQFTPSGELVLVLNYQVKGAGGDVLGVLQGRIDPMYLQEKFRHLRLSDNMTTGLAFEDGSILIIEPKFAEALDVRITGLGNSATQVTPEMFPDHVFASEVLSVPADLDIQIPLHLVTWADAGPLKAQWQDDTMGMLTAYLAFCALTFLMVSANANHQAKQLEA